MPTLLNVTKELESKIESLSRKLNEVIEANNITGNKTAPREKTNIKRNDQNIKDNEVKKK